MAREWSYGAVPAPTTSRSEQPDRDVPSFLPIRTVVKFCRNPDERQANRLFSRTLGKIAFIDHRWLDRQPDDKPTEGQFWLVDVVHETRSGEARGSFLVHPLQRVEERELKRLLPGMYREHHHGGVLLLEPDIGGCRWLLPLLHRKSIANVYSIMIMQ